MTTYKFYKLVRDDECIYVGQTTLKYLSLRMACHRSNFKKWKEGNRRKLFYYTENFTFDGVTIELIAEHELEDIREARLKENEYIIQYNPDQVTNKIYNPNYAKEYREKNKEKLAEKKQQYYIEVLKESRKQKFCCPNCDMCITLNSKSKHKSRCNPDVCLSQTPEGKWRFRVCGKNSQSKNFNTKEEAKKYRKEYYQKLNKSKS